MVLQDFLFPQEVIKYQSPSKIKYGDFPYDFYITDQRILCHSLTGLIFKKDRVVAERLEDITTLSYNEKGLIGKKGILTVNTSSKVMKFEGRPSDVKTIWQELQKYIRREK